MPRRWPPLKRSEIIATVEALGFTYNHTSGGHAIYKGEWRGEARSVTVSTHVEDFGIHLLKFIVDQCGCTRTEFYGATRKTARKAS